MVSDESHFKQFNVSLIVRDSHKKVSTDTIFEEKGELKWIQTEVPLLTSLTLYH